MSISCPCWYVKDRQDRQAFRPSILSADLCRSIASFFCLRLRSVTISMPRWDLLRLLLRFLFFSCFKGKPWKYAQDFLYFPKRPVSFCYSADQTPYEQLYVKFIHFSHLYELFVHVYGEITPFFSLPGVTRGTWGNKGKDGGISNFLFKKIIVVVYVFRCKWLAKDLCVLERETPVISCHMQILFFITYLREILYQNSPDEKTPYKVISCH